MWLPITGCCLGPQRAGEDQPQAASATPLSSPGGQLVAAAPAGANPERAHIPLVRDPRRRERPHRRPPPATIASSPSSGRRADADRTARGVDRLTALGPRRRAGAARLDFDDLQSVPGASRPERSAVPRPLNGQPLRDPATRRTILKLDRLHGHSSECQLIPVAPGRRHSSGCPSSQGQRDSMRSPAVWQRSTHRPVPAQAVNMATAQRTISTSSTQPP